MDYRKQDRITRDTLFEAHLPSGKCVPVTSFSYAQPQRLVCFNCAGDNLQTTCLKVLTPWNEDQGAFEDRCLDYFCQDCFSHGEVIVSYEQLVSLQGQQADAIMDITSSLLCIEHENMVAEIDVFVAALQQGHILPMDF